MPDIALIGERIYLFEKLFQDVGLSFQFVSPSLLGSPFLPQYRAVIIPTGFANPQYSDALPALQRSRSNISGFVKRGGVLTVFGPMTAEHSYDWLPHPLRLGYVFELSTRQVSPSADECSCLLCTPAPECDGYLIPGEGFRVVLRDESGRCVLASAELGEGIVVATSVHEFPAAEYILWAARRGRPAKI
ncbi:MAG TPA: hypothetical protein PLN19_07245 [Methanothrix sp.]|nr:hypothetical protein [Methanothrix sp.]HQE88049.1 hypothetical protein [Methanothrix sp.]HQI68311.1 hypothetical protein [Methanothrix sp.]HRS85410.1 hypothetical protein [Methanothrix sp.]HRT17385.1 hypothetical protein [Methanothrix sp.]